MTTNNPIRVIIFGNGTLSPDYLKEIKEDDITIGVDRAAYWLIKHHIIPDLAIGDFDSTDKNEFASIKQLCKNLAVFPENKDYTDMELAIREAAKIKPAEIVIYGAIGSRIDHTLANIHLLEEVSRQAIPCLIRDSHNEIRLVTDEINIENNKLYKYFSVIPVTDSVTVSITGSLYELTKKMITRGQTLGVSNEIVGKSAKITVHVGTALVIQSRD
jgi:thiamine pyrophosphokinase